MLMKRIGIALVVASSLALGGCFLTSKEPGTPGTVVTLPPATTPLGQQAAEVIGKVQDYTTKACSFVPTAQTVANLLASFGVGTLAGAVDVAQQICAAVGPRTASARRSSAPKTLRGIPIRGYYVS